MWCRFEGAFNTSLGLFMAAPALLAAGVVCAQELNDKDLVIERYLSSGLSQPTGMRFFAPGQGFAIEKDSGRVKLFDHGVWSTVLDLDVQGDSERGLLGIALEPDFGVGSHLYLYYSATTVAGDSEDSDDWLDNRLVRYQWNGNSLTPTGQIRTFGSASDGLPNGPNHDGGPLLFGPDGKLYGTTGDLNRSRAEQNNQSMPGTTARVGGIYRLNPDLSIPADGSNPFSDSFAQWYAYGVRNSFGLAFDPATGVLWDTENGPATFDEINLVGKGFNSGWSKIMGPDSRDPQNAATDLVVLPGSAYSDPEFSFLTPIGITSIQFLHGSSWGAEYDDAVIVGANNTGQLYLLRLNATRSGFVLTGGLADLVADSSAQASQLTFGRDFGVVTDLQLGPDGALYVTSLSQGAVYRIAPVPEPASWIMAAAGLCLIAAWRRTRSLRVAAS
jgi:glucose/arabinose dehydrogenase